MSKIEDLIRQYCPNGCEWKRLGDLIRLNLVNVVTPSFKIKRNDYLNEGMVAIISQEAEYISGYWNVNDNRIVDDKYVCFGDHSEHLKYIDFPFVQGADGLKIMKCVSNALNTKYLYYGLCNEYVRQNNYARHFSKLRETSIPIPPLPVQEEIVRILDEFTELEKELEKELEMRKKQYEWYRDELLTFGDGVERKTIRDVCLKMVSGGTPKSSRSDYYGGNHPWLRTQEVNFNQIDETSMTITDDGLNNSSAQYIPAWSVIVAMYGATVGRVAYNSIPLTTNQACCNLIIDDKKVIYKYVFYWLSSQYEYIKSLGRGSQTNINADTVKNLDIPVPSLQEQQRIVEILDTFDTLTTDLTKGLPAEIKMRHMQYEYYRDYLFGLLK